MDVQTFAAIVLFIIVVVIILTLENKR